MANLPPKPESPVKEDRRLDGRDFATTAARPMAQVRYHGDRFSESDKPYIPRSRPETDSYVTPYEHRRAPRDWERDRDLDRRRDPRRDSWRDPDRRDRPFDWRRDEDRYRQRQYDSNYRRSRSPRRLSMDTSRRSRSPIRRRSRSPRRYSRSRSPRISRSRTRSPRRRAYSPRNRARPSSRSRSPLPRSPPSKRLKLGNHSISDSPRTPRSGSRHPPSPTQSRSPHRADDKTPPSIKEKKPASPIITSQPLSPRTTDNVPPKPGVNSSLDHESEKFAPKIADIPAVRTDSPSLPTPVIRSSQDRPASSTPVDLPIRPESRDTSTKVEQTKNEVVKVEVPGGQSSSTPKLEMRVETRGRSPSPPKGPRGMTSQWRRSSKSPPKGPRNHPPTPSLASGPAYPTGPRADRRPQGPGTPVEQIQQVAQMQDASKATLPEETDWRKGRKYEPGPKGRYGVGLLELDLARFQSHRVHLNKDYDEISRSTRRALHDLDMATIDLRMAENREKIASIQLEKAKHGMLGIDALPSDSAIDK